MSENKKIEYKKEVSVTENTVQLQREQNKITIGDVAEALGYLKQPCHVQYQEKEE